MAEYIEKKAVNAEIERLKREEYNGGTMCEDVALDALECVGSFINFLPTQEDKSDTHLLDMLLDAINYTYKQLDGKYGNLSYVVSDKVKYIERVRAEKIEQRQRAEYEARERESDNETLNECIAAVGAADWFSAEDKERLQNFLRKYLTPSEAKPEVGSSLRDETGRLYEHIDTPITRYSEEHFDYDSLWDALTPKGGRQFGPADLEAAILFGYNLNPKHK